MIGASAAVYAVAVATATLLPDYTFFLMFIGPIRIKYIAGFYILISFLGSVGPNEGGNVAHLGGALIGFLYIKQLQAGSNWGGWITHHRMIKSFFAPPARCKSFLPQSPGSEKPVKSSTISQDDIAQFSIKFPTAAMRV